MKAGENVSRLPEIMSNAGYVNTNSSSNLSPDLKVAWNILDISTVYYQMQDPSYAKSLSFEQSRKVIHNILQETRTLYWKTLEAQKLLPLIDGMIEYMTLQVDDMNVAARELSREGKSPDRAALVKKRKYMEAVKSLSMLKRDMETAEVRLASLMGFHPSTEYKLVGPEYGNFELPSLKTDLAQLEWLALTNRPELRVHDLFTNADELKIRIKGFEDPSLSKYRNDPTIITASGRKKLARLVSASLKTPKSFPPTTSSRCAVSG